MISGGEKSRKHLKYYVIHGVNEISLVSRRKGGGGRKEEEGRGEGWGRRRRRDMHGFHESLDKEYLTLLVMFQNMDFEVITYI